MAEPRLVHTVPMDRETSVAVPSSIEEATWDRPWCAPGGRASLVVETAGVGDNAELHIELKDLHGRSFGQFTDRIYGNRFVAEIRVPAAARGVLRATATLTAHRLHRVSSLLTIMAPVVVSNPRWSRAEACHGEVVTLSADVEGAANGTAMELAVFAYDQGGIHDPVARFRAPVLNGTVDAEWECRWPAQEDEAPNGYVFRVGVHGVSAQSGVLGRCAGAAPVRQKEGRRP